ncbi:acyl-CoA N-acyltransferase [Crepidotus variabilis]|uniref:Acyl-CoA N-acyltransferase n=1 Tax=Crepidotus variabilis TaxID=179855 RepID=A0A9P6EGZ9_9AGAR|nr:acyl-CoA N-acyltransferase [Crepidotus variabilis]
MSQHNIILESPWKRIRLVPPSAEYDEDFAYNFSHPISRRYLRYPPASMSTEEARLLREKRIPMQDRNDFHILFLQNDGPTRYGGGIGCFHINDNLSCESGIIVHPELHGKNIATEAFYLVFKFIFEERRLHRVSLITGEDNVGMRGWLENVAGARLERSIRDAWKEMSGKFRGAKAYAILEEEWRGNVKQRLEDRMNKVIARGE